MTDLTPTDELRVQLPPPSPALVMHQAAARIREMAEAALAAMAANEYWGGGDWERGITNAVGGPEGELAAAFSPAAALALADWLDAAAVDRVRLESLFDDRPPLTTPALTFARQILGGQS